MLYLGGTGVGVGIAVGSGIGVGTGMGTVGLLMDWLDCCYSSFCNF